MLKLSRRGRELKPSWRLSSRRGRGVENAKSGLVLNERQLMQRKGNDWRYRR